MLFRTNTALWERLLREKDRQIDILAEQVDYLRAQLAMTGRALPSGAANPSELEERPTMEVKPYISDDELDVAAMLEGGHISKDQVAEVLEGLGFAGDFSLDIVPPAL